MKLLIYHIKHDFYLLFKKSTCIQTTEMEIKEALGMRIRLIREGRGLTQETLAGRVERAPESVRNWESGNCFPNATSFEALSAALKVPVRDFFDFPLERKESMKRLNNAAKSLSDKNLELAAFMVDLIALNSKK